MNSTNFVGKQFGKCVVKEPLARGGYGYSYLALDNEIQKERVVKTSRMPLGSGDAEDSEFENFKREGLILSRLKHPQIVSLIEQGESLGYRYMILDYIRGLDFAKIINLLRKRQNELGCAWNELLDPATALAVVKSALEPLRYIHGKRMELPGENPVEGLAHRDISSSNLMLGMGHEYGGAVHLIDFGIAKTNVNTSATINTSVVGNVRYMSSMRLMRKGTAEGRGPYWVNFKQTQHDVHAMGCFLWELLNGSTFIGVYENDLAASLAAIQNPETYSTLYRNAKVFDPLIREIIEKSVVYPDLKKDSQGYQYQDAGEMLDCVDKAYEKLSGGAPVEKVLEHFGLELENPEKLNPAAPGSTSRISSYSSTKRVKKGLVSRNKFPLVYALPVLLVLVVSGFLAYMLSKPQEAVDPWVVMEGTEIKLEKYSNPSNQTLRQKLLIGPKKEKKSKSFTTLKKNTEVKPMETGSPVEEKKIEDVLREEARKQKKSGKSGKKIDSTKSPEKRKMVRRDYVLGGGHRQREYQKSQYHEILNLIASGQDNEAYTKLKALKKEIEDPALNLLQAKMIKKRNPDSPKIKELANASLGKRSLFIASGEVMKLYSELIK